MITFNVVKERYGWAVRIGESMSMPFWSRDMAIRQANCLAADILRHGNSAEVIVQDADPTRPGNEITGAQSSMFGVSSRLQRPDLG